MGNGLRNTKLRKRWRQHMMHEGIRIALDPTSSQIKGLRQHAGAARFAY
ncbi:helix-turn-helix domain-containing protein, partial [uncultured Faecalibaculum sp.]